MDEIQYLSRIDAADQDLLTGARPLVTNGDESWFDESRAWPGELGSLLEHSTDAELLRIQYVTERHYSERIKQAADAAGQDQLMALAYLRVVHIQLLRNEPDMGYTDRELAFVLAAIRKFQTARRREPSLLEIGCGAGSLLRALATAGLRSISGVDIAGSAVRLAREGLAPFGLAGNVRQGTPAHLLRAGCSGAFDMVLLCDVIEHIPVNRVTAILAEVRQLLSGGGMVLVITPSAFTGPHDVSRHFRPPRSTPQGLHLHEYSLHELTGLLSRTGFRHLLGVRLPDCVRPGAELRLSARSMRGRRAMERAFPYLPATVVRQAVERFHLSAVCGWSATWPATRDAAD